MNIISQVDPLTSRSYILSNPDEDGAYSVLNSGWIKNEEGSTTNLTADSTLSSLCVNELTLKFKGGLDTPLDDEDILECLGKIIPEGSAVEVLYSSWSVDDIELYNAVALGDFSGSRIVESKNDSTFYSIRVNQVALTGWMESVDLIVEFLTSVHGDSPCAGSVKHVNTFMNGMQLLVQEKSVFDGEWTWHANNSVLWDYLSTVFDHS